jgi:hypothetical protein
MAGKRRATTHCGQDVAVIADRQGFDLVDDGAVPAEE